MTQEGLSVKFIGDDGQLKKTLGSLQDQLKRFQQGLKDASNPESLSRLNRAIEATQARIKTLSTTTTAKAFDGIKKGSNQAGLALNDFSRIVQDVPYGFMAISNNLNPMLESFNRLKTETGSSKTAFLAMVSGLTGPVGVGLALATVSSLLVKFGGDLFDSGDKVNKFKGESDALIKTLDDSKEAFDNLRDATEFLNQLGSINVKINGLGDLQDLREQNVANMQLGVDAEVSLRDLQKKFTDAAAKLESNKIEKRNLFGELISTEDDPDLKAAFDRAEKDLKDHQDKIGEISNTGRLLSRKIELQKIEDLKDAQEKEDAEHKKSLEAWNKYLEGLRQVQAQLRALYQKISMGDVDMDMVPQVSGTDWVAEFNKNLRQQWEKGMQADLPLPEFSVQLFDAEKKDIIEQYQKLFKSIGKELPKQVDFGGGFKMDLKLLNPEQLKAQLGSLFEKIKTDTLQSAQMISSVLTPAFQGMFNAITQGENPIQAFFESMKQAINQLISQLIAAAAKALVLRIITGGASGMTVPMMSRITSVRAFASGGIISGPTLGVMGEYAGARNNPEVVAPLNKLRGMIAGTGGGNVIVTGRLRGGDILLSNSRTTKKQKGKR
jgi:hypothetical protein